MQVDIPGVVLSAETQDERTDPKTGEVYKAQGTVYMLISERGEPFVKKIKCTPAAARRYAASTGKILRVLTDNMTTLQIDSSEYKLADGRSGVSNKLVEAETAGVQRGSFGFLVPDSVAPVRPVGIPASEQPRPASAPNGASPAMAGAR